MSLIARCLPAALLLAWPALLPAADLSHPKIPGWERFHREAEPSSTGGAFLLGELNCLSCHQGDAELEQQLLHRKAPVLSEIGHRVTVEFLRGFLTDPQTHKPGTLMPNLMTGLSDDERKERVEALTHFLASTGTVVQTPPNGGSVRSGEKLFHSVGCVACHDPQISNVSSLLTSVPLGKLDTKYSIPSLTEFLGNPHAVRPSGRMPSLNLKPEEARDIAHYLLREIDVEPNIKFCTYEGNWNNLPDFSTLQEKSTGGATGFDLTVAGQTNNFGVRFEGWLPIRQAGDYVFHLGSDDGSKLYVDGKQLVDVDGIHPLSRRSGRMRLEPGPHHIRVDYFQGGGEWILEVEVEGPKMPKQDLGGLLTAGKEPRQETAAFTPSAALVNQGREYFAAMGCANCHELKQNNQPIVSTLKAPLLSALKPAGGCLEPAKTGVPGFSLSAGQQQALAALLNSGAKPLAETPEATIHRTLTALNCYACHKRLDRGGVEETRNEFFVGAIPEMGDEGRIPPLLTGVGDKLNAEWLKHVMQNGASDRPYMLTRMPKFGHENVGGLITLLRQDQQTTLSPVEYKESVLQVKTVGRHMVGDQALSCIKCHTFDKFKATGIQSLDLTTMTRRLRQDWFRRYMVNPQTYRPGTRMPTAWPNGETILPELLEADTQKQVNALWLYLSDGNRAGVPKGIINTTLELVPSDEPIIYRNFIQGVSPRAIAVGYPERYNLAFDAERMNLALIWQGSFIDASMHWNGRGQGFQSPAGDAVLALPKDVPFAVINGEEPWPTQAATEYGYRFEGYRLDKQRRPHFRYSYKGMDFDDYPAPRVAGNTHVMGRTITITAEQGIPEHLWYRVAAGDAILAHVQENVFSVDDNLTISLKDPPTEAVLKKHNGKTELWLPVPAGEKSFTVDLELKW